MPGHVMDGESEAGKPEALPRPKTPGLDMALQLELRQAKVVPPSLEQVKERRRPGETWQSTLRQLVAVSLDLKVNPRPYINKKLHPFSMKELEAEYHRRRTHMLGRKNSLMWAIHQLKLRSLVDGGLSPPSELACLETPLCAFAFWYSLKGQPLALPEAVSKGLSSAVTRGNESDASHISRLAGACRGFEG